MPFVHGDNSMEIQFPIMPGLDCLQVYRHRLPLLLLGVPWRANTRMSMSSTGAVSRMDTEGRCGTECRPCRSRPQCHWDASAPALSHAASLFFAGAKQKRRGAINSRSPCRARLSDHSHRGKSGEILSRELPSGRPPRHGAERFRDAGAWRYPCARRGLTLPKLP